MSTKLTQKRTLMVDSLALQLVLSAAKLSDLASSYLANALKEKGYKTINTSLLKFLSAMDCGENYGSEIARNLGVSRQMVAKTVKELCLTGYLEQHEGAGKQKIIVFTQTGEQLMADARQLLAELDNTLIKATNKKNLQTSINNLNGIHSVISELADQ